MTEPQEVVCRSNTDQPGSSFLTPKLPFPFLKVGDLEVRDMGPGVQLQIKFQLSHLQGVTFLSHIFLFFSAAKGRSLFLPLRMEEDRTR